ncbi:carboxypeptidase B-like [Babylonia areolata]|uniref:carboxypeptidase B-like n=1 Tax=Babylonia areolata TaxID=304850 RepID=UPI003FD34065
MASMMLKAPSLKMSTDMVVSPEEKGKLMDTLKEAGITVTVQSSDLQADIDGEMRATEANQRKSQALMPVGSTTHVHNVYRKLSQVNSIMEQFAVRYPHLVVIKEMAHQTHEGRSVYYVEMLTQYNMNANITEALKKYTWVIIPVVNPDGYEYSWNHYVFLFLLTQADTSQYVFLFLLTQADTSQYVFLFLLTQADTSQYVFLFLLTQADTSQYVFLFLLTQADTSHDIYNGEAPFSEPETQNVRDLFLQLKPRVVSFLSVHAFSQLLLLPWAYDDSQNPSDVPDNLQQLV